MNSSLSDLFQQQSYNKNNFFLIAGPCVVENEIMVFEIGERVEIGRAHV